jgi:hypothetical protein
MSSAIIRRVSASSGTDLGTRHAEPIKANPTTAMANLKWLEFIVAPHIDAKSLRLDIVSSRTGKNPVLHGMSNKPHLHIVSSRFSRRQLPLKERRARIPVGFRVS